MRPSSQPTANPSLSTTQYRYTPSYKSYLAALNTTTAANPQSVHFSSYWHKGVTEGLNSGSCNDWQTFASRGLQQLPYPYFISSVTATYAAYSYETNSVITDTTTTTCGDAAAVQNIVTALMNPLSMAAGGALDQDCGGHIFRVRSCGGNNGGGGSVMMCVDCPSTLVCPSAPTRCVVSAAAATSSLAATVPYITELPGRFMLDVCQPCVQQRAAMYSILNFGTTKLIVYPTIVGALAVTPHRYTLDVSVTLSKTGTVWCTASSSMARPSSVAAVKQYGVSTAVTQITSAAIVTIGGLSPATKYNVYCYTENFAGDAMDLSAVLQNNQTTATICCKSVNFTMINSPIRQGALIPVLNTFALNALPASAMFVNLTIVPARIAACAYNISTSPPRAVALPSSFLFSSKMTQQLSASFVVQGDPGCYLVRATPSFGSGYIGGTAAIAIQSNLVAPSPPALAAAAFSNDGRIMAINLTGPGDQGRTRIASYDSTFACSALVLFPGASAASCSWISSSTLHATFGAAGAQANAKIGDTVMLKKGVLKPVCPTGVKCTVFASNSTVAIGAPLNPVAPSVSLNSPTSIGACDSINIDPTGSGGSGGRAYTTVIWTMSGSDGTSVSNIQALLSGAFSSSRAMAKFINIPNSLFVPGTYTFLLQLTNFLGVTSLGSQTIAVTSSSSLPSASIQSASVFAALRSQSVSLFCQAKVPSCPGAAATTVPLTFSWALYQGATVLSSISSISKDQRMFKLAPYTLAAGASYTLVVTVSPTANSTVFTTDSVTLQIGTSGLSAVIAGGDTQTASATDTVTVDASGSYDVDYPAASSSLLSYTWTCLQVAPSYGASCGSAAVASLAALPSLSFAPGTFVGGASYSFTVVVSKTGVPTAATTSVVIVIKAGSIPKTTIAAVRAKYNPTDNVMLTGTIVTTQTAASSWSSPSLNASLLALISLTPLVKRLPFTASGSTLTGYYQLAIQQGSLTAGKSYTFVLAATYSTVNPNQADAYSQVTVLMNGPPVGGVIASVPQSGVAFNTSFFLQASGWTDDSSDLPLIYVIRYYALDPSKATVVKNADVTNYQKTTLGQGLQSLGYNVTVAVAVSDSYNCSASATTTATVSPPLSRAALAASVTSHLAAASSSGDAVAVSQVIGAVTSTLNAVDCSAASPATCSSLFRSPCSATAHTCGPCLGGYLGTGGDANAACGLPASLVATGGGCTSGSQCLTGLCTNSQCVDPPKACPNSCSNQGTCVFVGTDAGAAIAYCGANDGFCQAKCQCQSGFHGGDCSLTANAMSAAKGIRESLCVGLFATLAKQDVTGDAMTARFSSIAAILSDISQINRAALGNCTMALVNTIIAVPQLAGTPAIAPMCANALSSVLAAGQGLPSDLLAAVSGALSLLNSGVQANMAVGQSPVTITTSNTRTQSSLVDSSTLSSQAFTAPQTAVEKFNKAPATALGVNLGSGGASQGNAAVVGVSLVQFTNNPLNAATASKAIGLQLSSYTTSSSGSHRRLSADATVVTVALANQRPVRYVNGSHPVCETSSGAPFAPDPSCRVSQYTSMNTTCVCSFSSSQVSALVQFASLVVPAAPSYAPSANPNAGSPTAITMLTRWPSAIPTSRPTVYNFDTPDMLIHPPDTNPNALEHP